MSPETARSLVAHLSSRLNIYANQTLEHIAWDVEATPSSGWLDPWLVRIAVLVGDIDRIQYASGRIEPAPDGDSYIGDLFVFTPSSVVEAHFTASAERTLLPRGPVTAHPRAAVTSLEVGGVSKLTDTSGSDWPKHLSVKVKFESGAEVELPRAPKSASPTDQELAAFLPNLLLS